MAVFLKWLNLLAPWIWTTASIVALQVTVRGWWISRRFEHARRRNTTTAYVIYTSYIRLARSIAYSIVGVASIAVYFAFPWIHESYAYANQPAILVIVNVFTLAVLLGAPISEILVGTRTLRYLLTDTNGHG